MPLPRHNEEQINTRLLDHLLTHAGFHTIQALGQALSRPIDGVLHDLGSLRTAGCVVDEHPQHGVRLARTGLGVWVDYMQWRAGHGNRRPIELYATVSSTQDAVRRIVETRGSAADGAVVIADQQTSGRGRLGRRWIAPAGSAVLFSRACVLQPGAAAHSTDRLMLATAVAIAEAIEDITAPHSLKVRIRWPNDIMIMDHKLAGILVERFTLSSGSGTTAAIIGIGINVSVRPEEVEETRDKREERWGTGPAGGRVASGEGTAHRGDGFRHTATSLALAGRSVDRLTVLAAAIEHLDNTLAEQVPDTLVERWRKRSTLLGRRATLYCDGRPVIGRVIDLDPCDGLIVAADTGGVVHLPGATTTIVGEG